MSILDSLPKKQKVVHDVDGIPLHLNEMSLAQQMSWNKFYSENKDNHEKLYAYLLTMCCDEFKDVDPKEIEDQLSPKVLLELGNKIIDICGLGDNSEKKDLASQTDSSSD